MCEEFERAAAHEDLWNAPQKEFLLRGTIQGYDRMYWGRKILEWSAAGREAPAPKLHLHARYTLDSDDPKANILWPFGLHDRPWPERPGCATIRSMARSGMKRKTDNTTYLPEIKLLEHTGEERNQ
jgi:deoxyribodipyrimidine photo-lyase